MRLGGDGAGLGAAGLDDDQRLVRLAASLRRFAKAIGVDEALDINADGLGLRFARHVVNEVADFEVTLIAAGNAVAKADAIGLGAVEH